IPSGTVHLPASQTNNVYTDIDEIISDSYIEDSFALDENFGPKVRNLTVDQNENVGAPRILVVDDNADMRDYLKSLLEKKYSVFTASNGLEALHVIKSERPLVVLSDIMMPVMDGIRLTEEIKRNRQTEQIPVMLITARAGEESKIAGYET